MEAIGGVTAKAPYERALAGLRGVACAALTLYLIFVSLHTGDEFVWTVHV
jgi:hypothetical protein